MIKEEPTMQDSTAPMSQLPQCACEKPWPSSASLTAFSRICLRCGLPLSHPVVGDIVKPVRCPLSKFILRGDDEEPAP